MIAHGHEDGREHFIAMRLSAGGADLKIEVEDDGRAFDPADAPLPDPDASVEKRTVGGLGLHLVRSFVDELSYSRSGERNLLTLLVRARRPSVTVLLKGVGSDPRCRAEHA